MARVKPVPDDLKQWLTHRVGREVAAKHARPGTLPSLAPTNAPFRVGRQQPDGGLTHIARPIGTPPRVSKKKKKKLKLINALIVLLKGRLAADRAAEEWLIDMVMPKVSGPHPAILDQARRNADFRADFLKRYDVLKAAQLHHGSKADNTVALAGRWQNGGKIFGVEIQRRILYPAFQFDDTGRPKPVVAEVLKALGSRGGWQVASWFTAPNGWLPDDQRPVDVMDTDPGAVADAAREATSPSLF